MNLGSLFSRYLHPEIAGFARYMCDLAGDDPLPRASLFNPGQIASIVDYVYTARYLPEKNDYLLGYSGSRMRLLFGADLGGLMLSEVGDPILRQNQRESYDRVIRTHLPLYMRGYYVWPNGKSVPIERLLMPMVDEEGRANTICGMSIPEVAEVDLAMYTGQGPARLVGEDELMLNTG